MHEDAPIISAERRERVGTKYAKRLRASGRLPAVVYGHKEEPVSISLDRKEAVRMLTRGERVFRLSLDGDDKQFVLIKEVQFDHLGTDLVHADFARVDLDERVEVRVPISLIGDAKGLKSAGAVLMHPITEVEIECSLFNLPDEIEVDISDLDVGESITAGEITLPKPTMVLLSDPETVLATITTVEEEAPDEASTVDADAEPEVLTRKKDSDEAGDKKPAKKEG